MSDFDDDVPTYAADPDRVRDDPAKGTLTAQVARHFEAAWDQVEPGRRERELNWPMKPWPIGRKTAFLAHLKKTILPGYDNNTQLLLAMIDEFCQHSDRYFSVYRNWAVWKQWNQNLDRLRWNVLQAHPEMEPGRQTEVDPGTMERHAERLARWERKLDS